MHLFKINYLIVYKKSWTEKIKKEKYAYAQ